MVLQRKIGWALGLGMAMAISSASAAESGWYIGLNAGQSQADLNKNELDAVVDDAFFFAGAPITSGRSSLETVIRHGRYSVAIVSIHSLPSKPAMPISALQSIAPRERSTLLGR